MINIILSILSFLVLFAGVFAVSDAFVEPVLDAKWHATAFAACVLLIALSMNVLCLKGKRNIAAMADVVKWQVVAVCSAQAVFGMLQIFGAIYGHGNETMGSFDNPAGFASCLAFSLPVGVDLIWKSGKKAKWLLILAKAICVMAIVASGSRTGLICILLFALFLVRPKINGKVLGFCMLLVVLFVLFAVFGMKTNSTMGRWFIIQRTVEMIAERPFAGWGIGGFAAHYMNFQADYFAEHAASPYVMLADNVHHPLNEFLLLSVNFGLAGLLAVLFGLMFTFCYCRKHPSDAGRQGICILIMIVVFAMLSYPFLYPFTWLMLIYSLFAIYKNVFRYR